MPLCFYLLSYRANISLYKLSDKFTLSNRVNKRLLLKSFKLEKLDIKENDKPLTQQSKAEIQPSLPRTLHMFQYVYLI